MRSLTRKLDFQPEAGAVAEAGSSVHLQVVPITIDDGHF